MSTPRVLAGVLAMFLPFVVTPTAHAAALITELPGLPGQTSHRAIAVNDLGQVVGTASGSGRPHTVLWGQDHPAVDLGTVTPTAINQRGQVLVHEQRRDLGPYAQHPRIWQEGKVTDVAPAGAGFVAASAINADGHVPMTYSTSPYGYHLERASVWRDGTHTSLPVSGPNVWLSAINDAGVVAGSKLPMFGDDTHAFRCVGSTCTRLATVPGTTSYSVRAINEAGVVVGNRGEQALRWEGDRVTVLASPGGVAGGAQAINERGDVVGWSSDANGVRRATLWPGGGKAVDLGVPGPSEAVAVNDRGDVIGWTSANNGGVPRGFVWRAGQVTHLGSLGGTRSLPVALNERGTIVGESTDGYSAVKAVRWTLVGTSPVG